MKLVSSHTTGAGTTIAAYEAAGKPGHGSFELDD